MKAKENRDRRPIETISSTVLSEHQISRLYELAASGRLYELGVRWVQFRSIDGRLHLLRCKKR